MVVCAASALATPGVAQDASAYVAGAVYRDINANHRRDAGEPGVAGVAISNQADVVVTDAEGAYRIAHGPSGIVFVSVPDGYRASLSYWIALTDTTRRADFGLTPHQAPAEFSFIHASDTHIAPASVARTRRLRALTDSVRPEFVLITGDLVRDALRVGEAEARSYYDLFASEATQFRQPLWTVPGNHEIFGVERAQSRVDPSHPLYDRGMYRRYRGPDYYSFTAGGVHFVGLNTVDVDDQWYHGHVDTLQFEWLRKDLAVIPPDMPVVTFNHIPFFTAIEAINGYTEAPPAPTIITVRGKPQFRHVVSNARDVLALVGTHRLPLALGGHMHAREQVRLEGIPTRFFLTAAVVGPSGAAGMRFPSGVTVYRVRNGRIDDGTFVPMPPDPAPSTPPDP